MARRRLTPERHPDHAAGVVTIGGFVEAGFEGVRDAFVRNFEERGEVGAAVAAWVEGKPALSLFGGMADRETGRAWSADTLVMTFSMTKALTTTCVHHLAERRGLDVDLPVAEYWPAFAAAGKGGISLRAVLSHRAGLPTVEGDFTLEECLSWEPMVEALASQVPLWTPLTQHGYHLRTFGWLVGEVFRRASGRTIGRYFASEIAQPLGLDWHLGLAETEEPRVARLVPPSEQFHAAVDALPQHLLLVRAMRTPSNLFRYDDMFNDRALRACELPSTNSLATAESVVRLYASILGWGPGPRLLWPETIGRASLPLARGYDCVLMTETGFSSGFQVKPSLPAIVGDRSFGHAGAGGSLSFADPDARIAFAYTPSRLCFHPSPDPRSEELVARLYGALATHR